MEAREADLGPIGEGEVLRFADECGSDSEPTEQRTLLRALITLTRNLDVLRRVVRGLTAKGVRVKFVKEGLTFTGNDSA